MVVIGYGIAALIVIILLIVFNVRATSGRQRTEQAKDTPPEPVVSEAVSRGEDTPPSVRPERPESQDQNYRNALRGMKSGPAARQTIPTPEKGTPDAEYREAMRKMRNSSNRKK